MRDSWDRLAGETEEWYDRFRIYLYMGPNRTVAAAHTFATRFAKGAAHPQLSSWERAARRREWKARAADFDVELCRKALAHDERLKMVAELLRQVYGVLRQADMLTLSKDEARQLLPTFRLFFRDLLQFHQIEAARFLAAKEGDKAGAELSADELVTFLTEMDGVRTLLAEIEQVTNAPASAVWDSSGNGATSGAGEQRRKASWQALRDVLSTLYGDEASARRLVIDAHLESTRIQFAGSAVDRWHAILTEAEHGGRIEPLIEVVQTDYPNNPELKKAVQRYRQALVRSKKGQVRRKK
jgi:hypothetical protein